jgi:protein SCO1/2
LVTGLALAGCDQPSGEVEKLPFRGVDITGADYGSKLKLLPDQNGRQRSLEEFKGKVVVVFFGFTQCPDVCPSTMAELAQVKQSLGPDGDKVQGIFVSVDPERDTPEVLSGYMASFDPSFVALRGTLAQTQEAAKEFKVFFAKAPGKTDTSYTVDHTAGSYLFDTQGRVRVFVRYGTGAEALASDIKTLLQAAPKT